MFSYLLKRFLLMVPTLLGVLVLNFAVIQFVPGGPVEQLMSQLTNREGQLGSQGTRRTLEPRQVEEIKKLYGFDKPAHERFLQMLGQFARFDLGKSFFQNKDVWQLIKDKLPVSISLGLWTFFLSYLVAVPLGVAKAVRAGSRFDFVTTLVVLVGYAIPGFVLGVALLVVLRQSRPAKDDLLSLVIVAAGVVVGFPLLTALALQYITSAHSIVFVGLLPLATAVFGVLRGGERPKPLFWLFSGVGSATVVGFALVYGGEASLVGDLLMIAAIVACGLGYAEGAKLSRRLGGWQVISWALLLSLPLMGVIALVTLPHTWQGIDGPSWLGLAYVSVFSMLVGFVFWYRGLALGGIAGVGQLQLLQPFFGLTIAAALLGESVDAAMMAVTVGVVLCVAGAKRFA